MIKPYLWDIINDHKNPKNLRVHSGNEVIDSETQFGKWKNLVNNVSRFYFF